MEEPKELSAVLWKIDQGFTSIGADHIEGIVKWARALAAENADLRDLIAALKKE